MVHLPIINTFTININQTEANIPVPWILWVIVETGERDNGAMFLHAATRFACLGSVLKTLELYILSLALEANHHFK